MRSEHPARATSVEAYHQIIEEGLLTATKARVYEHLYVSGPLTARELTLRMARAGENATSYHKRLSELRDVGVVAEVGIRTCAVTKRRAITWDVTASLPGKPVARPEPDPPPVSAASFAAALALCHELLEAVGPLFATPFRRRLAELEAGR